jgi:hypothetical protein
MLGGVAAVCSSIPSVFKAARCFFSRSHTLQERVSLHQLTQSGDQANREAIPFGRVEIQTPKPTKSGTHHGPIDPAPGLESITEGADLAAYLPVVNRNLRHPMGSAWN